MITGAVCGFIVAVESVDDVRPIGGGLIQHTVHDVIGRQEGAAVEDEVFDAPLPVQTERAGMEGMKLVLDAFSARKSSAVTPVGAVSR